MELQNWVGSLRENMMTVHVAEVRKGRLMEWYKNVIHTCVHGHQECKNVARKRLYQVLVSRQKRSEERRRNPEISKETNGRHFDPRTGADRSVAHARVPFPVRQSGVTSPRPKTLQSARNIMQTWEPGVAVMKRAKKVDVDAMMLALKSIMTETSFREAGVCKRRSFNFCADLRTAALNCLDDKVPVSIMKQGPPMTTTNMVQTMRSRDEGEQGEDEEMKNEVTQDEIWSKYAGTVVKVITTTEIERQSRQRLKNQKQRQAKVGPQARASGTAGEAIRAKANTGTGIGKSHA